MRSILRAFLLAASVPTGLVSAQQPQILNAQISTKAADHGLRPALDSLKQSATPLWVGYVIPTASRFRGDWNSQVAYLEKHDYTNEEQNSTQSTEQNRAAILFRLEGGKIDKVRAEAVDRQIDAGGLRFVWLSNVAPDDSIAVLKSFALAPDSSRLLNSAVFMISLHRSDAAVPALVALAAPGPNLRLREQAAFWLASQRGHDGFTAVQNLVRNDKDDEFRAKLAFDVSLSKDSGAIPELVRMAHEDTSPHVRSQAQFWMASKGGKIVTASLQESAENDPDADNRKKAVFAMSRLPNGEATTQLIQLAENSKYPEVRKQAVFWLGQSHDPKALDYLTKLVTAPGH